MVSPVVGGWYEIPEDNEDGFRAYHLLECVVVAGSWVTLELLCPCKTCSGHYSYAERPATLYYHEIELRYLVRVR